MLNKKILDRVSFWTLICRRTQISEGKYGACGFLPPFRHPRLDDDHHISSSGCCPQTNHTCRLNGSIPLGTIYVGLHTCIDSLRLLVLGRPLNCPGNCPLMVRSIVLAIVPLWDTALTVVEVIHVVTLPSAVPYLLCFSTGIVSLSV